jgi:hypothetical protein
MRAYATQVETLRRLRNGGSQVVRVEHVHVSEGGQVIIGNVRKDGTCKEKRARYARLRSFANRNAKAPEKRRLVSASILLC